MLQIRLNQAELSKLNEFLTPGWVRKIDAIKVVKNAAHHRIDAVSVVNPAPGVGLAEAKDAVEVLMAERGIIGLDGLASPMPTSPRGRIVTLQPIKRIIVDMGSGEIEVDLEGMSLQFLSQMNKVPLSEIAALVDLYNRVKEWTEQHS